MSTSIAQKFYTLLLLSTCIISVLNQPTHNSDWQKPDFKIASRRHAEPGEIPWQISIHHKGFHSCGGAIIEVDGVMVVITAAHCIFEIKDKIVLYAGDINLKNLNKTGQSRVPSDCVSHQNYSILRHPNDIAICFLDEPFILNQNVQPIKLPDPEVEETGNISVSGWGRSYQNGPRPDILHVVELPIVDRKICAAKYSEKGATILESMFCAGYLEQGGTGSCQGDSGGGARSVEGNYIAGIISWGIGCGIPEFPAVYTKVSYFMDWIKDTVANDCVYSGDGSLARSQ